MSRKPVMRPRDWAEYLVKQTLIGVVMAAVGLLFLPTLGKQAGIFLIGTVWAVSTLITRRKSDQVSRQEPHPARGR